MMKKQTSFGKRQIADGGGAGEVVQMIQSSSSHAVRPGAVRSNSKKLVLGEKKSSRTERNSRSNVVTRDNSNRSTGSMAGGVLMSTFRGLSKNSSHTKRSTQAGVTFVPNNNNNNNTNDDNNTHRQDDVEMGSRSRSMPWISSTHSSSSRATPGAVRSLSPRRLGGKKSDRDNNNNNNDLEMGSPSPLSSSSRNNRTARSSRATPGAVRSNSPRRLGEKKSEREARARTMDLDQSWNTHNNNNDNNDNNNNSNNDDISTSTGVFLPDLGVAYYHDDHDERNQRSFNNDDYSSTTSLEDQATSANNIATTSSSSSEIVDPESRQQSIPNDTEAFNNAAQPEMAPPIATNEPIMINAHCEMAPPTPTKNMKTRITVIGIAAVVILLVIVVAIVVPIVVLGGGDGSGALEDGLEQSSPTTETSPSVENIAVDPAILPGLPVSTWGAIMDPKSPQYKAYSWIAQDPNLQQYEESQLRQRFALATFYHALGGPRWGSTTWMDYTVDECSWLSDDPESCNEDGNVVFLNITKQRGFRGSLPAELSLLSDLKGVDFSNNFLDGNLTEVFSNVFDHPSLESLWCSNCRLSGSFPLELVQMTHATGIFLSENDIAGELPSEIGRMSNLKVLDLGDNNLSGFIPSTLGSMSSLEALKLSDNQLSLIPSEIGKLSKLEKLDLSNNQFDQIIPSEIGALHLLGSLVLFGNSFHGTMPSELQGLTNLITLMLSNNELSGTIPEEMTSLSSLEWLQLTENRLTGSIPASMGRLTSMTKLELGSNMLTSTIPAKLGLLSGLVSLHVYKNDLSGTIPNELASIPSFRILNAKGNPNLVEELPQGFCSRINQMNILITSWCGFEGGPLCC